MVYVITYVKFPRQLAWELGEISPSVAVTGNTVAAEMDRWPVDELIGHKTIDTRVYTSRESADSAAKNARD